MIVVGKGMTVAGVRESEARKMQWVGAAML